VDEHGVERDEQEVGVERRLREAEQDTGTITSPRVRTMSTAWSREPANQSKAWLEWWIAWKRQSPGTRWNARCTRY